MKKSGEKVLMNNKSLQIQELNKKTNGFVNLIIYLNYILFN